MRSYSKTSSLERRQTQGRPRAARTVKGIKDNAYWRACLAILFLAALLWRLAYLRRLAATPLAESLVEDSRIYWEWSDYIRKHGLIGHHAFFLGPLYPYVLAAIRALLGDYIGRVLVVQACWGAAAVTLLADAGRRLTNAWIGVVVGVLTCFYQMAVFFDGLILMESLVFFLEAVLLWWIVRTDWRAATPREYVLTGLAIALLAVGRPTSGLLLAPAIVCLIARSDGWQPWRDRLVALLAGFVLVVGPVAVRNYVVAREWIPLTYNFGYNLYVGLNPGATGAFVRITGTHQGVSPVGSEGGAEIDGREYLQRVEGATLGPSASSAYWAHKATRFASDHKVAAARLWIRKLGMVWNFREYPQIENVDEFRQIAGPIGMRLLGSFATLGVLGFAGLWIAWRHGPAGKFLLGYVTVTTLGISFFFVTDRYRHHLVPALALLAGLAVAEAVMAFRSHRRLLHTSASLLCGALLVYLPAPHLSASKYAWGFAADLGSRWLERGRPELAVREFDRAIAIENRGRVGTKSSAFSEGAERGELYYNYAVALGQLGRRSEALSWFENALAMAPDNATIARTLADRYQSAGRAQEASRIYSRLSGLVGGEARALASRGWQAARNAEFARAETLFTEATRHDPTLFDAWGALIRLQIQAHRLDEAKNTLRAARDAGLPRPAVRAHDAFIAAVLGDRQTAMRALADVPIEATTADPTLADVVSITRKLLNASGH